MSTQLQAIEELIEQKLQPLLSLGGEAKVREISFEPFTSVDDILNIIIGRTNKPLPCLLVSIPTENVANRDDVVGTQNCVVVSTLNYSFAFVTGNQGNNQRRMRNAHFVVRDALMNAVTGLLINPSEWPENTKIYNVVYLGLLPVNSLPEASVSIFQFSIKVYFTVRNP